jgi:GT2 family glycosyltransferase
VEVAARVTELTYCVVCTAQRDLLVRGLDAIARERAAVPFATEVLVLDNASGDGSAEAAGGHPAVDTVIALERRTGKAENDSTLMARAKGRYALLLNEDSELLPGATQALHAALDADPGAAVAGAALLRPDGAEQPSAWRFPSIGVALAQALLLHRRLVVQSRGTATREVDWCQSAAMLVRRDAAEAIGWMDPDFFVYGDEVDFQKRLRDAGHRVLWVPGARAIHHEQLSTGAVPRRRIVEFHRNRDRYLRKHHGRAAAFAARPVSAFPYLVRAIAALVLPGHDPRRYLAHAAAALAPGRGEGIREAASRVP